MPKVPVFLSFSGDQSRAVAKLLRNWLPDVLQAVEPWTSTVDIETGERWGVKIGTQLQNTNVGILCLTPENIQPPAPWIMFEAGALSKQMDSSRVTCLCCFGVEFSHIRSPLNDFQNTQAANLECMVKLVSSINTQLGEHGISNLDALRKQVVRCWPEWEKGLAEAEKVGPKVELKKPNDSEMLAEMAARLREIESAVNARRRAKSRTHPDVIAKQLRGALVALHSATAQAVSLDSKLNRVRDAIASGSETERSDAAEQAEDLAMQLGKMDAQLDVHRARVEELHAELASHGITLTATGLVRVP